VGEIPAVPRGLSREAAALWRLYLNGWQLDEHGQTVLRLALEVHDRMRQAQALIKRDGLVLDKGRMNPACLIERDSRRDLLKTLRSLGLSLDPVKGLGAP
jgi:phage terminase small subunit